MRRGVILGSRVVLGGLVLLGLLLGAAAVASAQTYTLQGDELVVTALPAKSGETDCLWVDAGGRAKRGACPTIGLTAVGANQVFAGPTSGGSALPTFRSLTDADIPNDLTLGTVSGTPTFGGAVTFNSTVQADISLGAISGRRRWQTNGLGLAALAADNGWAAVSTGPLTVYGTGTVSGDLSVGGVASSLVPSLTDTYNLGSSLRLWNEGFVSQLNAVIYAEQTATLFGGWSVVGKNAGTFAAAVGASDTSINFGKAMTNGHFVVVRAHDTGGTIRAESLQVTGATGCTTCTVTRGLNTGGTGYAFAQGTSYLVLGTTGDGRIELRAYSTPQISVVEQGGTYNAQTERVRIGYLDGAAGMGATTGKVGIVIGDASQYLRYYDGVLTLAGNGSGITSISGGNITTGTISADRIATGSITADKLNVSTLSAISANIGTVTAGTITGATIQTATSGGRIVLDPYDLRWFDSSGSEIGSLGANGIRIRTSTGSSDPRYIKFGTAPNDYGVISADANFFSLTAGGSATAKLSGETVRVDATSSTLLLIAGSSSIYQPFLRLNGGLTGSVDIDVTASALRPTVDDSGTLGTATHRWDNIHLNLPFGASTSLTYVLVNDPTDVSRLYAFTGGADGAQTCGAGQAVYSITVEKGLVTGVACR